MSKHVDVIALLAVVLGLLMVTKISELRVLQNVQASEIRIQNAVGHVDVDTCPLSKFARIIATRFQ